MSYAVNAHEAASGDNVAKAREFYRRMMDLAADASVPTPPAAVNYASVQQRLHHTCLDAGTRVLSEHPETTSRVIFACLQERGKRVQHAAPRPHCFSWVVSLSLASQIAFRCCTRGPCIRWPTRIPGPIMQTRRSCRSGK